MIESEAENTAGAPRSDGPCLAVAATESPGRGEWIISRYDDVRAVLSDERFAVAARGRSARRCVRRRADGRESAGGGSRRAPWPARAAARSDPPAPPASP